MVKSSKNGPFFCPLEKILDKLALLYFKIFVWLTSITLYALNHKIFVISYFRAIFWFRTVDEMTQRRRWDDGNLIYVTTSQGRIMG